MILHNIVFPSLLLEMSVNFNTSYLEKGNIVKDRKKIAKKYLTTGFFIDAICILPYIFESYLLSIRDEVPIEMVFFFNFIPFLKVI